MLKNLTCIVCPIGCDLQVELEGNKVVSVSGNTCPRGKKYAEDECTAPKRTVTSTVKTDDGRLLPVKTETAIPKEKIFECMNIINKCTVKAPVKIGDVIAEDVFGSRIVATGNLF